MEGLDCGARVAIALEMPGLSLASAGEALENGAEGDLISVLNPTSHAVVLAEVTGPDAVRLEPGSLMLVLLPAALAGCGTLTRLSEIGRPAAMIPTSDPTRDPNWRPLTLPMPAAEVLPPEPGTLWRNGSRAFFKDQRAARVGDLLTVVVNVTDAADVKDATQATRNATETGGITNLFGLETQIPRTFSGATPASLVNTNSNNGVNGTGEA